MPALLDLASSRDSMSPTSAAVLPTRAGSESPCGGRERSSSRHHHEASLSEAETTTESARIRF